MTQKAHFQRNMKLKFQSSLISHLSTTSIKSKAIWNQLFHKRDQCNRSLVHLQLQRAFKTWSNSIQNQGLFLCRYCPQNTQQLQLCYIRKVWIPPSAIVIYTYAQESIFPKLSIPRLHRNLNYHHHQLPIRCSLPKCIYLE